MSGATATSAFDLTVRLPDGQVLLGRFVVMKADELVDFVRQMASFQLLGLDAIARILVGWNVADDDGRAMPLTRQHLAALLDLQRGTDVAIARAYVEEMARRCGISAESILASRPH